MNKPLLVLSCPQTLSLEQHHELHAALVPVAEGVGAQPMIVSGGAAVAVHHDLAPLIAAIEANTRAIESLVRGGR